MIRSLRSAGALWIGVLLLCGLVPSAALAEGDPDRGAAAIEDHAERGPVKVQVRLTPAEPRFGDVLVLDLEARARAGVEVLMPEFGEALARFAIVDFQSREELADDGSRVWTQRYQLEVERSGPAAIPPLLVEFRDGRPDADALPPGEDAFWLESPRVDFEVASVLPVAVAPDLRPLPERLAARREAGTVAWRTWAALGAAALALAALAFVAFRLRQRALRTNAYDQAMLELSHLRAEGWPSESRIGDYYVTLSGLLRRYLERRFELRSPELTTEEFLEAAAGSRALSSEWRTRLHDFLAQADLVKFAGLRPDSQEIQAALVAVERFLEDTRPGHEGATMDGSAPSDEGEAIRGSSRG